eukprot:TRINITY_DN11869_c2_g2_i1.p1 TRINITY_DN11869_c2_g2~~TRINITY_DN11869_c2_g2_i1.p1  ORF type:complete len:476 (+),score=86.20 TRINITY_DN11869_c2_g2_i1:266-1693(+)
MDLYASAPSGSDVAMHNPSSYAVKIVHPQSAPSAKDRQPVKRGQSLSLHDRRAAFHRNGSSDLSQSHGQAQNKRNWFRRRVTSLFHSSQEGSDLHARIDSIRCENHSESSDTFDSPDDDVFGPSSEECAQCNDCAELRQQAFSQSLPDGRGLRKRLARLRTRSTGSAPSLARVRSQSPRLTTINGMEADPQPLTKRSSSKVLAKGLRNAVRPWRWGRQRTSSNLADTASRLERRLSVRPSPTQAMASGILKQDALPEESSPRSSRPQPRMSIQVSDAPGETVVDHEALSPLPTLPASAGLAEQQAAMDANPGDYRLAVKLSLKRKLARRPSEAELQERGVLRSPQSDEVKNQISTRLERRLSIRSDRTDLTARNIIQSESNEELAERRASVVSRLSRKLSERLSVHELKEKKILKFDAYAEVTETWGRDAYDRRADKPWTRLTNVDKIKIRKELNDFKRAEMDVHPDSEHLTRFH